LTSELKQLYPIPQAVVATVDSLGDRIDVISIGKRIEVVLGPVVYGAMTRVGCRHLIGVRDWEAASVFPDVDWEL